ncbi:SRPBCC domain-containing protein [Streptomyces sp. SP2-10]|uniref:SRPBCC domain-containing protein n=1 Tax=Streptomyces sp. SP2-10 TaxID=2873385 RepID=UPI001CA70C61|nr:SRPBCC domain-containing protein [Streptomyces sp. SP2-10]MBY8840953.1 SRPBCC domain-containing protein [Streptomyces sp. SP2-10]
MDAGRPTRAEAARAADDGPAFPARHGSFSVGLSFTVPRAEVFRGFADPSLRSRWFRLPGGSATAEHALDFRVGGGEEARNVFVSADTEERLAYRSRFLDIVPDTRIVHVYEAEVDGSRRWISLVTVELSDEALGSRLTWTEQYTWLVPTGDGTQDAAHLRGGTRLLLNGLSTVVNPDRHAGLSARGQADGAASGKPGGSAP